MSDDARGALFISAALPASPGMGGWVVSGKIEGDNGFPTAAPFRELPVIISAFLHAYSMFTIRRRNAIAAMSEAGATTDGVADR